MSLTYVFFYRAVKAQGVDRNTFSYTGWFQPYSVSNDPQPWIKDFTDNWPGLHWTRMDDFHHPLLRILLVQAVECAELLHLLHHAHSW